MFLFGDPTPTIIYRRTNTAMRHTLFGISAIVLVFIGIFIGGILGQLQLEKNEVVIEQLTLPAPTQQRRMTETETTNRAPHFNWEPNNDINKEKLCLALNVYFEAKSEPLKGKIAVALTPIARARADEFPDTVCEVIWQKRKHPKTGKWVAQFTWTLDGKPDTPVNKKEWQHAQNIANAVFSEGSNGWHIVDFTNGATHYHADYVAPWWKNKLPYFTRVGTHLFYGSK